MKQLILACIREEVTVRIEFPGAIKEKLIQRMACAIRETVKEKGGKTNERQRTQE